MMWLRDCLLFVGVGAFGFEPDLIVAFRWTW